MISYIIRRLLAAVVLLFIVSAATFAIFYLVPRLAGSTPETLATRYVGRAATPETVNLIAHKLGFYDPVWLQYGRWVKGIFVGADYDYGSGVERCPAPCFGYSFVTRQPVWPDLLERLPVTLSLAIGHRDGGELARRAARGADALLGGIDLRAMVMLQGVVSPFWLTTPIIGLAMASSSRPIARMKARCGVRSRPSVVMRERSGIAYAVFTPLP